MRNLLKLFPLLLVFAVIFNSCEDEFSLPAVTAPTGISVELESDMNMTFNFTAEAGFKSSTITATNGTATVITDGVSGAKSGTIEVSYTAGSTLGAGSVTLTISDAENQTSSATAVISVLEGVPVTGNITENTTWETGKVYILLTRVAVVDGATLTIEPGVIVKGAAGSGPNSTALLVTRGSTLIADGTPLSPIIFTSVADYIEPGEIESPNLDPTLNGFWGGVIILGNAPISADAATAQIEGIPASDPNGNYGGDDPTDNSGIIRYVSIRHGGTNIGEGNEINGLTLGGVGSGTTIENIEIVCNQDDGIEWFGGTVNVSNVVVWNTGDDAIDCDQSWAGTLDNFVIVNPGDECFELDGPEGAMAAKYTIKHGTVYAGVAEGLVDNDANTWVDMDSIYFFGLDDSLDDLQDFDQIPTTYTCSFTNFEAAIPAGSALTDFFLDDSHLFTTEVAEGANTVGAADISVFDDWSWTAVSGALDDLGL